MVDYTKKETVVWSSDCSKNKHLSIICYHTYFIWKEFIVSKTKKRNKINLFYVNNITFSNCTLNFKWQVIKATSNLHLSYIFFQTKLLNQFILLFKYVQNTCIHVQVEPTIWSPGSCPVALRLCGRLPDHLSYAVETTCNIKCHSSISWCKSVWNPTHVPVS